MITAVSSASPEETPAQASTPEAGSDRNSIGFLLNCPVNADFMPEFPKSTTLSPNSSTATFTPLQPVQNGYGTQNGNLDTTPMSIFQKYGHMIQENNLDVFLSNLEFQTFEQSTNSWQMPQEDIILWSGQDNVFLDRGVLEQRAFDVREKLKYTSVTQNAPNPPSKELMDAIELITANKLAAYINLYFRHWHRHAPMVHEPSFNLCTAALPLVLAMMSIGGMVMTSYIQHGNIY